MKKAFSQNGRRNIAVVVDLLFLNQSLCAITTPLDAALLGELLYNLIGEKKNRTVRNSTFKRVYGIFHRMRENEDLTPDEC